MSTLHEKLLAIQSELKAPKEHKSPMGYEYRSCSDILEAVKPLLKAQSLLLTLSDEIVLIGTRFYVKATATLMGEPDAEGDVPSLQCHAFAREEEEKRGTDAAKITGATSSYARKYALSGLFCLDDTKDADATDQPQEPKKHPAAKPAGSAPNSIAPATQDQLAIIDRLCQQTNTSLTKLKEAYHIQTDIPTVEAAAAMIEGLQKKLAIIKAGQPAPEAPSATAA